MGSAATRSGLEPASSAATVRLCRSIVYVAVVIDIAARRSPGAVERACRKAKSADVAWISRSLASGSAAPLELGGKEKTLCGD